ncbi:cytochrome P450-like enzyme [Micromonospora sp. ATCC 39149]|uniref:Cytochrome P450 n=1 Tax=Micromonospora carbonacea TaxID=47853 RepID=A0A7D5YB28_9ACTN|nr:cytochrome P450 [Micromonospora sp. ATCC 39149]EEP70226.1 cytochrome P450-like enzyme [Micromonospora sp. ATCC 39149]QLJ96653.1 cytochrome P450 [Micromonospora carbonacea]
MINEPIDYPLEEDGPPRLNPLYSQLRESKPVLRAQMPYGEESWLTLKHSDFKFVMGDSRFSRALAHASDEPRVFPEMPDINIMRMDPPEHGKLRKIVTRGFTERRVAQWRPQIQQIVDELLDEMEEAGPPVNLVTAFGTPLPATVIAMMLGVPVEDRPLFTEWSKAMIATTSMPVEQIRDYLDKQHRYVADMVADRIREPRDDMISDLAAAYQSNDGITEEEIVGLGMFLLATGHGSTANQISYGTYVLFSHPEEWAKLVADPTLAKTAADELLRYALNDEAAIFSRYATEDVEVSGTLVRAGEPVLPSRVSANYDDTVFKDPERLDISRSPNPHVTFGYGLHYCPGAGLARAQMQIAFESLVRRFPKLQPAVPLEELEWKGGSLARTFEELPVTW